MLNPVSSSIAVTAGVRRDVTSSPARNAIAAVLRQDDILVDLAACSKERAFEDIARFVAAQRGLPREDVLASLLEREEIGSTALGQGFAIPHARVPGLLRPIAAFVRMEIAIPFDAPDGKPVSDLLVLLVPQRATDAHLLLLAEAAGMFCDV